MAAMNTVMALMAVMNVMAFIPGFAVITNSSDLSDKGGMCNVDDSVCGDVGNAVMSVMCVIANPLFLLLFFNPHHLYPVGPPAS